MTARIEPWWVAAGSAATPLMTDELEGPTPRLLPPGAPARLATLRERMPGFTWDWHPRAGDDAGLALARLLAAQQSLVGERLDRLPAKLRVAFLRRAGIEPRPGTPARAIVEFAVASGARRAVRVPVGFRLSAPPIDGEGDLVSFETTRTLFAQPATIAAILPRDGETLLPAPLEAPSPAQGFHPFPERPSTGELLIGLDVPADAELQPRLTLAIRLAARTHVPDPVSASLGRPAVAVMRPLIRWEVYDEDRFVQVEVIHDETQQLTRSGLIELALPRRWRPGHPPYLIDRRHWLRARVLAGVFEQRPLIHRIGLNAAEVVAVRTVREEPLEPLDRRHRRLRHTPIRPGSTIIEIDEGGLAGRQRWTEVADLSLYGPADRVYRVDTSTGVVQFGDGTHGAALPDTRQVVALAYQVGADAGSGVVENTITVLADSAPFLIGVDNPFPASGGRDPETQAEARRRGPAHYRARGRAVSPADYALLALEAPGARIARAHAVAGHHPGRPGRAIPGVVGVYLLTPEDPLGPPVPDEDDLRAVSRHLAEQLAPAGVEVVAAVPVFHTVRVEATVLVDSAADTGTVVSRVLERLDTWLHPLTGGDDGEGWPFGGVIEYHALTALIDDVPGVFGVTRLSLLVDGIRAARCADYPLPSHDLIWPGTHEIIPEVAP